MPSISQIRAEALQLQLRPCPAYNPRKLKVVTIGAGFAGLTMAHKIQHQYPELQDFIDHTIYEALDSVGGTWKVNTYPGVQCDVPAHIYAFPFDPNPKWSQFYANGDEILEYVNRICDKWNLRKDIQFNSRISCAEWDHAQGKWRVLVEKNGVKSVVEADVVISALGFLSRWKWPDIPGVHDFKGHRVHSADWDHSFDYSGKRIGKSSSFPCIIGNGSSGIQILPQMAKLEGTTINSFQRGPTWITPSLGSTLGVNEDDQDSSGDEAKSTNGNSSENKPSRQGSRFNPLYTGKDMARFNDGKKHQAYRKRLQHGMNQGFRLFQKDSPQNQRSTKACEALMREKLNHDPVLCGKLIPKWTLGCRRLTPGDGYLEAFTQPNVHVTNSPIRRITATGIETSDETIDLDVIICATGFDASNIPHFPVIGRDGLTLADKWADEPESYLSLACPSFPNYFIFTGPNATVGHGTLIPSMSWSADWMVQWLRKIAAEGIKCVAPTQRATDDFVRYGDLIHQTLTWTGGCSSWYKNHRVDGRVTATFPGSALLYKKMIETLRPEDFEIEYLEGNRFRFMGNGFTEYEGREGVDLAWYLEK